MQGAAAAVALVVAISLLGSCEKRGRQAKPKGRAAAPTARDASRPLWLQVQLDVLAATLRWRRHQERGGPDVVTDYDVANFGASIEGTQGRLDFQAFALSPLAYGSGSERWTLTLEQISLRAWNDLGELADKFGPGERRSLVELVVRARDEDGAEEQGTRMLLFDQGADGVQRIVSEIVGQPKLGLADPTAPAPRQHDFEVEHMGQEVEARLVIEQLPGDVGSMVVLSLSGAGHRTAQLLGPDLGDCALGTRRPKGILFEVVCAGEKSPKLIVMAPAGGHLLVTRRVEAEPGSNMYEVYLAVRLADGAQVVVAGP